jgi:hypothetical protein
MDEYTYKSRKEGMGYHKQAYSPMNCYNYYYVALDGYHSTEHTHGLWKHKTRPVWFLLVVDDLVIKYVGREHVEHLKASLGKM